MAKFTLDGRVTVVTGAESGFGAVVAAELARRGAVLVVQYDASFADAKRLVRDVERDGGRAIAVKADPTDAAQVGTLCAKAAGALGRVDTAVVNTAGTSGPSGGGAAVRAVLPAASAAGAGSLVLLTDRPGDGASDGAGPVSGGPSGVRINTVVTGATGPDAGPRAADAVALLAGDGLGAATDLTLTLGPAARLG